MKLETIIIDGVEYYQFVLMGRDKNLVLDLFSNPHDIEIERKKAIETKEFVKRMYGIEYR